MENNTERGSLKAAPNVTPLVDVVLVLLILFIILMPAVDESVRLPRARHASPRERGDGEPILLVLLGSKAGPEQVRMETEPGRFLDIHMGEDTGRRLLVAHLRARLARRDSPQVFLKADGRLGFRHVQTLFDLCRDAGAEMVLAVTAAEDSPSPKGGLS